MERIESLAAKLGHHLPDIRSRAASNLLFKLESGVVDGSVLGSAHCLSVLSAALHSALRSCVERVSAGGTPEDGYVRALLGTLRVVGRCAIKDESAGTLSQTLSTLYEMSTSSAFAAHSQAISEVRRRGSLENAIFSNIGLVARIGHRVYLYCELGHPQHRGGADGQGR